MYLFLAFAREDSFPGSESQNVNCCEIYDTLLCFAFLSTDENISNDNGNDNGLQTESPSDSETATPDISNTDSSNPDNSNSDTTMDDDPTLVIDSWPQDLIDNVENMTKGKINSIGNVRPFP